MTSRREVMDHNTSRANPQTFVDMSTPSPHARRQEKFQQTGLSALSPAFSRSQAIIPPRSQNEPKANGFVNASIHRYTDLSQGNTSSRGNCRTSTNTNRRHRRPNMEAIMRSSRMSQRVSSMCSQRTIPTQSSRTYDHYSNSRDVPNVPILGECVFDQPPVPVRFSQDEMVLSPMAKLHALRETLADLQNESGYIDRATFSQAFEMTKEEFQGYEDEKGVDGNALLIDAVMEMEGVDQDTKLRFIFDTMDVQHTGVITFDQVVSLLQTNFATAKLDVLGTDFISITQLMFSKAHVVGISMTYEQFYRVFRSFITSDEPKHTNKAVNTPPIHGSKPRSTFSKWYGKNKQRIWWLMIYIVANNLAFWLKWYHYKVDPALGWGLRIARGCAQVVMLNVCLVLMPMLRSITAVMKQSKFLWHIIPFDDHIEAHKLCGTVCLLAGVIHTGAHISNEICLYLYATPDQIQRSIFIERKVAAFEHGLPPFTLMLQQIPVWTGVILISIACIAGPLAILPRFRQGNFNMFWYSHMLFGVFLFVLCFHGITSWLARASSYMWIGPPVCLYLIERRFRYGKSFATPVRILEARALDNTYAVFMDKPRRFIYRPGMYLFVNCPTISAHEWHPFTISSAPGDQYLSIHMRKAGDWTGAFHTLMDHCHDKQIAYPNVYLDGPVGAPTQDYHRYKTIICVAGGIGVTPFASILKDCVHLWEEYRCSNCNIVRHPSSFKIEKLYFHWTTRAQESLGWFDETMNQITMMDRGNIIEAHQYLTTVKAGDNTDQLKMIQEFVHEQTGCDIVSGLNSKTLTHFGRPDWDTVFAQAKQQHPGEEIGVFFCGPHALEEVLGEMCMKYSNTEPGGTYFDYHSEKFA